MDPVRKMFNAIVIIIAVCICYIFFYYTAHSCYKYAVDSLLSYGAILFVLCILYKWLPFVALLLALIFMLYLLLFTYMCVTGDFM